MAEDGKDGGSKRTPEITDVEDRLRQALRLAFRQYPRERERAETAAKGGIVSKLIGDDAHHPGSIAFISVIGLILILATTIGGLVFMREYVAEFANDLKTVAQSLMTLIGTILGYLFGKTKRQS